MSIIPQDPDSNKTPPPDWESWRESLAIALQGQYGTAKTWRTVSEQARDGWRSDAADIMASLPSPPSDEAGDADLFFQGALEALDFAWSAIHVRRYDADEPGFMGPDDFYHGIVKARIEVDKLRREYRSQRGRDDA